MAAVEVLVTSIEPWLTGIVVRTLSFFEFESETAILQLPVNVYTRDLRVIA